MPSVEILRIKSNTLPILGDGRIDLAQRDIAGRLFEKFDGLRIGHVTVGGGKRHFRGIAGRRQPSLEKQTPLAFQNARRQFRLLFQSSRIEGSARGR